MLRWRVICSGVFGIKLKFVLFLDNYLYIANQLFSARSIFSDGQSIAYFLTFEVFLLTC